MTIRPQTLEGYKQRTGIDALDDRAFALNRFIERDEGEIEQAESNLATQRDNLLELRLELEDVLRVKAQLTHSHTLQPDCCIPCLDWHDATHGIGDHPA